jgi:hypothetical protein
MIPRGWRLTSIKGIKKSRRSGRFLGHVGRRVEDSAPKYIEFLSQVVFFQFCGTGPSDPPNFIKLL